MGTITQKEREEWRQGNTLTKPTATIVNRLLDAPETERHLSRVWLNYAAGARKAAETKIVPFRGEP